MKQAYEDCLVAYCGKYDVNIENSISHSFRNNLISIRLDELCILKQSVSESISVPPNCKPDEVFIDRYLKYRIENDPAKRLLQSAFGKRWTSNILEENVFARYYG